MTLFHAITRKMKLNKFDIFFFRIESHDPQIE